MLTVGNCKQGNGIPGKPSVSSKGQDNHVRHDLQSQRCTLRARAGNSGKPLTTSATPCASGSVLSRACCPAEASRLVLTSLSALATRGLILRFTPSSLFLVKDLGTSLPSCASFSSSSTSWSDLLVAEARVFRVPASGWPGAFPPSAEKLQEHWMMQA